MASPDDLIREARQAVRDAPEAFLPRVRLAEAFLRKASAGEAALRPLAEREYEEALRRVPPERAAHVALIAPAAALDRLEELKLGYESRWKELAFAAEILAMLRAAQLARAAAPPARSRSWGARHLWIAAALILPGVLLFGRLSRLMVPSFDDGEGEAPAPAASAPAAIPDAATPAGKNFLEAKAVYDRIEPGMSIHQAAEIVGMDANAAGWGKDFGRSMTPECITLTVRFADGKVAWAALSRDSEEGSHASPGRILAEKGARP